MATEKASDMLQVPGPEDICEPSWRGPKARRAQEKAVVQVPALEFFFAKIRFIYDGVVSILLA